jgi:DNA replication protein DnaC
MERSITRAVAQEYARRREEAEQARDRRVRAAYASCQELEKTDRAIAASGADLLLEAIDPGRPRLAASVRADLTARRQELLQSAGLKPDFDQIIYNCAICRDTGWISQETCSCYRSTLIPFLMERANLRALSAVSFDQFDKTLFSDQPDPARYLLDVSPRQQILGLKLACQRFIRDFDQPDTGNLLFVGKPGTGKTFMMACIARALLDLGHSVLYITAPQLFDSLQEQRALLAAFNPDEVRLEKALALQESLLTCDLLLIDDLGTESGAASRYADLLAVIDGRSTPGLKTIISSNNEPANLRDIYDERLLSRLVGGFAVYRFIGEDVRMVQNRRRRRAT